MFSVLFLSSVFISPPICLPFLTIENVTKTVLVREAIKGETIKTIMKTYYRCVSGS
jgi:hypothetical protein